MVDITELFIDHGIYRGGGSYHDFICLLRGSSLLQYRLFLQAFPKS